MSSSSTPRSREARAARRARAGSGPRPRAATSARSGAALLLGAVAAGLVALGCGGPSPIIGCTEAEGLTPVCGFHNPEDLVADPSGRWLLVSQAPLDDLAGEITAFAPKSGEQRRLFPNESVAGDGTAGSADCPGPPDLEAFAPHGIDLSLDGRTLFVVNHGGREAVELLALSRGRSGGAPELAWAGCVPMPDGAMMNDVAALPDGTGFVVTQMASSGLRGMVALARGGTTGQVLRWTRDAGLRPVPGTEGAGPNGVAVARDGSAVYFSEWTAGRVVRVALDGSGRRNVDVGFNPDNLTWRADGRLLVAGQMATPLQAAACFEVSEGTCGLPSAVAVLDPQTLEPTRLLTNQPAVVTGGLSVALEHDGRIWLGTFGGDRLASMAAR